MQQRQGNRRRSDKTFRRKGRVVPCAFEALERRVMLTDSPYSSAVFTAVPGTVDVLTQVDSGAVGGSDLNGDNIADLIIRYDTPGNEQSFGSVTLASLIGQPGGTFDIHNIVSFTSPAQIEDTDTAHDLNGDNRVDVIVSHYPGGQSTTTRVIDVYLANANGTYSKTNQSFDLTEVATSPNLNVFDMNGDGEVDMVLTDFANQALVVLLGNGDGTFDAPVATAFPNQPVAFMTDLNGDNITDVVAGGFLSLSQQTISVFLGQANGGFNLTPTFTDSESNYTFATLLQLTGDTRPELVVYTTNFLDPESPSTVTVLRNNGDATFTESWSQTFQNGVSGGLVTGEDLDNDGDNDMIVREGAFGGENPFVAHIERNNGNAVFTDVQQITLEGSTPTIFPLDVDNDAFLDLVLLVNSPVGKVVTYFNNHNATFITPAVTVSPTPAVGGFGTPSLLNGDLKFDVIFSRAFGQGGFNDPFYAFVNTTGRAFGTQKTTELGANTLPDGVVIDLNDDSNADLIVFQGVPVGDDTATGFKIYTGVGDGSFLEATPAVNFGGGIVDTNASLLTFDDNASRDLYFIGEEPTGIYVSLSSAEGTPQDGAGNTTATAIDIGVLTSSQLIFNDAVSSDDTDDFYKFVVVDEGRVNLSLTGLTGTADIKLLDSTGAPIANGSLGGTANESISKDVEPETYYIRVFNVGGQSTGYTLAASLSEATPAIGVKQGATTITSGQATSVDLGGAILGTTTQPQLAFSITNTGTQSLTLGSVQLPSGFVTVGSALPSSLAPNASATLTVALPTTALGIFSGNITVPNNSGGTQNNFLIPIVGRIEFPITNLHDFANGAGNGTFPLGQLTAIGGTLYGSTGGGGANNKGIIYSTNTSGAPIFILHHFEGGVNDGSGSNAPLTNAFVGGQFVLFGATASGGEFDKGTLFRLNAAGGGYQMIHSFGASADDGTIPANTMVVFANRIYGVTSNGGTNSNGTIFSINVDGSDYQVLHRFEGGTADGRLPSGGLIQVGTTLYGVTQFGGVNNSGTLYSIDMNGANFTVLRSFDGPTSKQAQPRGTLAFFNNALYGVTLGGTLYRVNLDGTGFDPLHEFTGQPGDGLNPTGELTIIDSQIYGITQSGGHANRGVIYRIDIDGDEYAVLHSFPGTPSGHQPSGKLVQVGTTLFNATTFGGSANQGELYSISTVAPAAQLPDLTGTIDAITLNGKTPDSSDVFVPGDKLGVEMTISNTGSVVAPAGATGVNFYLSTDQTLDKNTDFLFQAASFARGKIDPGNDVSASFKLQLPLDAPSGSFYVIADIDSTNGLAEADESNDAVSSFQLPVALQAGDVGTRKNVSLTIPDSEGRLVTLKLAGGGTVQATPGFNQDGGFFDLNITNATANTNITITTKKLNKDDPGITTLNNVTVGTSPGLLSAFSLSAAATTPAGLGKFLAKTTRLIGDFNAPQGLKSLTLDSARGATIHIGASGDPKASITLALNLIQDLSIDSDMPIKSLTAFEWKDNDATPDELRAPSIGGITMKGSKPFGLDGDFEADVFAEGIANPTPTAVALGAVKIAGDLAGSAWDVTGNAAGVTVSKGTSAFSLTTHGGSLKMTKLNTVASATFTIDGDAGAVTTMNWLAGALTAKSVKSIAVKGSKTDAGDMQANVTLLGDPANTKLKAPLGSLAVANFLRNAAIRVAGNSGAITVGGIENSTVFVGAKDGVIGAPATAADFDAFTLAGFTVKGLKTTASAFVNSLVAAQTIAKATLKDVVTANNATAHGIIADKLAAYTRTAGALSVKLSKLDDPAALTPPGQADAVDDFLVLIV